MRWLWVFLGCHGGAFLVGSALFLFTDPLRGITEHLVCAPDERLVTETQVDTGDGSSVSRDCCARRDDTRAFGKCDWSSSMSFDDGKPLFVPVGLSFAAAFPIAGALTLLAWALFRKRAE